MARRVIRDSSNGIAAYLEEQKKRRRKTDSRTLRRVASNDVNDIEDVVTSAGTSIVSNISTVISTIIVMLILSPLLTLISLGLLPLFLWITTKLGKTRCATNKGTQESIATLTVQMQETLSVSGILLINTFGRQKYTRGTWRRRINT